MLQLSPFVMTNLVKKRHGATFGGARDIDSRRREAALEGANSRANYPHRAQGALAGARAYLHPTLSYSLDHLLDKMNP